MSVLIKKVTIVLITIIMISNFIMPNEVQAVSWSDVGKDLINGLFDLLRFIADVFLQLMQKMMVGTGDIQNYKGDTEILYSPGIIFLNRVPGLNINFIGANTKELEVANNLKHLESDEELITIMKNIGSHGYKGRKIVYSCSSEKSGEDVIYKVNRGEYSSEYLSKWGLTVHSYSADRGEIGPIFIHSSDSKLVYLTAEYRS